MSAAAACIPGICGAIAAKTSPTGDVERISEGTDPETIRFVLA
jgi:hypothetical protein